MAEKKIHTRGDLPPTGAPGAPETEVVRAYRVACDGAGSGPGAALGHPRVWLSIPEDRGWVECGYCDKRFVHADHSGAAGMGAGGAGAGGAGAGGAGSDGAGADLPGRQGTGAHPGVP